MTMTAAERADFRALCSDFFARQAGEERLRRYLETPGPGFDQELWADLTKLGVVLAALPEDLDGGGAGLQDLAVGVEEAGRVLHGAPLATTLTVVRVLARYGFLDDRPKALASDEHMVRIADHRPGVESQVQQFPCFQLEAPPGQLAEDFDLHAGLGAFS